MKDPIAALKAAGNAAIAAGDVQRSRQIGAQLENLRGARLEAELNKK